MTIEDALNAISPENRVLDPVGVIEILSTSFLLGDRTLVQDLRRTPWMAYPDVDQGWQYAPIPPHGFSRIPTEKTIPELKRALREEMLAYLYGRKCVGILLSGGLDSRIVAGIVRELQLSGEYPGDVIPVTWGLEESKDVLSASEISRRYDWEWIHLPLSADSLARNIMIAGQLGAEFSPYHLHAMEDVRQLKGLEAILAGSYVTPEYSGRYITHLKSVASTTMDRFGLVLGCMVRESRERILEDAYGYKKHITREAPFQYHEIEQLMHYMRRKLQACMTYIASWLPLFQPFTSAEVCRIIWSLDPKFRDLRLYTGLLSTMPGRIHDLGIVRGGRLLRTTSSSDQGQAIPLFHRYGVWLRRDLGDIVTSLVKSDALMDLGLFNKSSINQLLNVWAKANTLTVNAIDETVSWLASLAVFIDKYQVYSLCRESPTWSDRLRGARGTISALIYQMVRERLRY